MSNGRLSLSIEEFGVLTSPVASSVPPVAAPKKRRPPWVDWKELRDCKIWLVKALAI
jgi:hypothetical protein